MRKVNCYVLFRSVRGTAAGICPVSRDLAHQQRGIILPGNVAGDRLMDIARGNEYPVSGDPGRRPKRSRVTCYQGGIERRYAASRTYIRDSLLSSRQPGIAAYELSDLCRVE